MRVVWRGERQRGRERESWEGVTKEVGRDTFFLAFAFSLFTRLVPSHLGLAFWHYTSSCERAVGPVWILYGF